MPPAPPKSTLFPYTTLFRSMPDTSPMASPISGRMDLIFIAARLARSEEHTSELQSRFDLVCRLLLEKKKGDVDLKVIAQIETDSQKDYACRTYRPHGQGTG